MSPQNELPSWVYIVFFGAVLLIALLARRRNLSLLYDRALESNLYARGLGLLAIVVGILIGFLLLYSPIADALSHKQTILLHYGVVAAPAFLIVLGLTFLIAGKHSKKFVVTFHGQPMTALQKFFIAGCALLCTALEIGFRLILRLLGYQ